MSFSFSVKKSDINPITERDIKLNNTKLTFNIEFKKNYDGRKRCQIEDEEP